MQHIIMCIIIRLVIVFCPVTFIFVCFYAELLSASVTYFDFLEKTLKRVQSKKKPLRWAEVRLYLF